MKKKIVYIASPYSIGNQEHNVHRQIFVADLLVELGFIPRWPLSSHYWNEVVPHDYEYWMELDYQEILHCDYLIRLQGESSGADREVLYAQSHNIPVFYSLSEFILHILTEAKNAKPK